MSLSSRVPSAVDSAGFVPELWSKKALDAVHSNLVCVPLVDHRWESELKYGDTMNVGILNTVNASEVVVGTAGSALNHASGAKLQIVIDQWYQAPVVIDEMTMLQAQISLVNKASREAGYAISKQMDTSVNALFSTLGSSTVLGADGTAVDDDLLISLMETLDENDVPRDNRALIGDPSMWADIMKIDKFVRSDYGSNKGSETGKIGSIYGCPAYISNNLTAATTGAYGALLHRDAIAIIAQQKINIRKVDEPLKHQSTILADALWGVKEMRDTFGKAFYTRKK